MQTFVQRVNDAIRDLRQGKLVILTDHPDRENEGDLIFPAQLVTPEIMNFIIRNTSGIVCLVMLEHKMKQLGLNLMVPNQENSSTHKTPFGVSIDAKFGITTGVSAYDRTKTVLDAIKDGATQDGIVKPGHIFPLQAMGHGVLARAGHTEGAADLVKLAGFGSEAILCEIMNKDGTMARGSSLKAFAHAHQLSMLSIADIINYRLTHENLIEEVSSTLPLEGLGQFEVTSVRDVISGIEHLVLYKDPKLHTEPPLVRVHSSCQTGDIVRSQRCDCYQQLQYSLKILSEQGGLLIYLQQEGRGIGLFNKIRAYALQDQGMDTVAANIELGFPCDLREYNIAANVLRNRGLRSIRLLTNNPAKVEGMQKFGIEEVEVVPMPVFCNGHNRRYLQTKKEVLGHTINRGL